MRVTEILDKFLSKTKFDELVKTLNYGLQITNSCLDDNPLYDVSHDSVVISYCQVQERPLSAVALRGNLSTN